MNRRSSSRPKRKRGPPPGVRSTRRFPWTKAEDDLLGTCTDREVAEKLNRTIQGVRDRRGLLGKPAFGRPRQQPHIEREPPDRYAQLFSTKSDRELRAILGWSYTRIHTRRRQLMRGKVKKAPPPWTVEEDQLLGTKPDRVLARAFGRPVSAVRSRRRRKRIRLGKAWRPEDEKVLGTRTDRQIALLLGRSQSNVAWRRKKLRIAPKAKPREWTPEEEDLLGSKPDHELARLFGRTTLAVQARRNELGRAKPDAAYKIVTVVARASGAQQPTGKANAKPGASYCTWTEEEDSLLGKFADEEVARRLGYPVARVSRRRRLLGIPSNNPNHRHWTAEEIGLLGTRPDKEVAPLVNRSTENVRCKRLELGIAFYNPRYEVWKPEDLALLGKLPDEEVARRTGHSVEKVRGARTKRHILSVHRIAPVWTSEEEALLGTAPDAHIAARLNRTIGAVRLRRAIKGIKMRKSGDGSDPSEHGARADLPS